MKKYTILFSLLMLVLTSCEDVITVKMNEQDTGLFAVEGKITTRNQPWVRVSRGLPVNEDKPLPAVSGALVTISDDATPPNIITLKENSDYKGYYGVPDDERYFGVPGRIYTITIEIEGVTLRGSDKLNPVEPIDSIQVRPSLRGDKRFLGIFSYGQETPGKGDYYKWDIYVNDSLLNGSQSLAIASDDLVDGNYVNSLELYTDFHDPMDPSQRTLKFHDTVYVAQTSLSAFAYNYYFQMINQGGVGFLFSVPPANIESNFTASDGKVVLGLFTAHDVSISNKVVIDEAIEEQLDERP